MQSEAFTLYKLIVLYLLDTCARPLTRAQICDFVLSKEYTTYMTMQEAFVELLENNLIIGKTQGNRTYLSITEEGHNAISYFGGRINKEIRKEIAEYLKENALSISDENAIKASYQYNTSSGLYDTHLSISEKDTEILSMCLSVQGENIAEHVCDNWHKESADIYSMLVTKLYR